MSRRRLFELLAVRWGFALLVAAAIAAGLVATTVAPPANIPSVALGAPVLYRAEVGEGVFITLYLATMALALALQNRGFTEIGSGGIKARDIAAVSREDDDLMDTVAYLAEEIQELRTRWEVIGDDR